MRTIAMGCTSVLLAALATTASAQTPVGTGFTYQGVLSRAGAPLTADADLRFALFDAAEGGTQIGATLDAAAVAVSEGRFSVELDFGPGALDGNQRWLEISVRETAAGGAYSTLAPRQPLTAAPYAIQTRGIHVSAGGQVGVGTLAPETMLDVRGPSSTRGQLAIVNNSHPSESVRANAIVSGWGNDIGPGATGRMWWLGNGTNVDRSAAFVNQSADLLRFGTSGRAADLVISADGNVGIGTTTPAAKLDVDGTLRANVLQIVGGSDIAEPFEIDGGPAPAPGMVVAIHPAQPGVLRIADRPYDATVAGIISGAGGVNAGLTLRQPGTLADGRHPVALTGRVWCLCDADAGGAIEPGALLTTSATPGHAMRASDRERAPGAVLGKAMSALPAGRGLVLVLVNLQ